MTPIEPSLPTGGDVDAERSLVVEHGELVDGVPAGGDTPT